MFFGSYLVYAFGIAAKINKWAGVILAVLASLVMVYMNQLLMLNYRKLSTYISYCICCDNGSYYSSCLGL